MAPTSPSRSMDEVKRIERLVGLLLSRMLELASVSDRDLEALAGILSALLEIAEQAEE